MKDIESDTALYLSIVLLFLTISLAGLATAPLRWDEGSFMGNAEALLGTDTHNFEENRPIALSAAIAAIWTLTGESTFTARLVISLSGLAAVYLFYLTARSEDLESPLVVAGMALSPLFLYWSFHAYSDIPALALMLGSLYFYTRDRHLYAGGLMALATTFRYVYAVLGAGMLLGYLYSKREQALRYVAGGLLGSIPFLGYSTWKYGGPLQKTLLYINRVSRWSDSELFAETLANLKAGWTAVSVLGLAGIAGWRESRPHERGMLLLYSVFVLVYAGNSFTRYWLPALPLLVLISARKFDRRQLLVILLATFAVSGMSIAGQLEREYRCAGPFSKAMDHVSGLEGEVVSDRWAEAGYLLDREVHGTWTGYGRLHSKYGVDYAVVREELNYSEVFSASSPCGTYHIYELGSGSR
ncbi:MAG: ArnT family glycosyltransferase [Candidatus Nanohaloarchaea archaeon]